MGLDKFIVIGTSPFSSVIKNIIMAEGGEVVAYSTSKEFIVEDSFDGLPIIPMEEIFNNNYSERYSLLNTIGYSQMNTIRERVHSQLKFQNMRIASYISKRALVYSDKMGDGCIVMPGAFVGPNVEMGYSNIIYSNSSLTHHINIGNFNFIGSGCVIGGRVNIGDNCFFGLNSTIRNRCSIDSYTIIGSGANVTKSITSQGEVWIGNPAKPVEGKKSLKTIL